MFALFVIFLENNKWFLHVSDNCNMDNNNHIMNECSALYDFVRKNPPIKVYETVTIQNKYDINTIVKIYMECFGINNVRGGMYYQEILPDYLKKGIDLEMSSSLLDYSDQTIIFHNIRKKPDATDLDYISIKDSYEELLELGYIEIKNNFIKDLSWLYNVVKQFEYVKPEKLVPRISSVNREDNIKYKKLLEGMEIVRRNYFKLHTELILLDGQDPGEIRRDALIKTPKFIFDSFVYHKNWNRNWDVEKKLALDVLKSYEFMGYKISNAIDCMEFDLQNPAPL